MLVTPEVADLSESAMAGDESVLFESSSTGSGFVEVVSRSAGDEVFNAGVEAEPASDRFRRRTRRCFETASCRYRLTSRYY